MQNNQNSEKDLIIILIVTLSVITVNLPFFSLDLAIKNILSISLLFIPGYAILSSIFPLNNLSKIKKFSLSVLISLGILLFIYAIKNIFFYSLIIDESNLIILLSLITFFNSESNLIILLSSITLIFVIIGYIRRKRNLDIDEPENTLICRECGGHYTLKKGESPEDFISCPCGGRLFPDLRSIQTETTNEPEEIVSKSIYFPKDLILIFLFTIIALIISFSPFLNESLILTFIALPFLLFLSGYSLIAVLFLKKDDLENIERAAFSFGLSVLIAPIIGLILNYTPYGIKLINILIILSIFSILMCIIAYIRRWKIAEEDRFIFKFKNSISKT